MTNRTYAYLRASTKDQDATRAADDLATFAAQHGLTISATFTENDSGAKLERPELFRLLSIAEPGDVLLLEQVDRLSRLTAKDWEKLRGLISAKGVRVVALDLPTSWALAAPGDDFTQRMFSALNDMMLDMLAAIARKDYEDRRRRQKQGIEKGKAAGKFKGKQVNEELHARIVSLVENGMRQREAAAALGCALSTVVRAMRLHRSRTAEQQP
ncbi:recombinase family protein [Salmonella enterica]|nr:recombinase family protein [Salmonella enterica]